MLHDAGEIIIYQVEEDTTGDPPYTPRLIVKARQLFGELTVGVTRFYSAAAVGMTVSRLIEIWRDDSITTGDLARIGDRYYNIQQIAYATDEDGLLTSRLTLEETDGSAWEGDYDGDRADQAD